MSRIFAITAVSDRVSIGGDGRGEITFTVTNSSARPLRGRLRVRPLGSTKGEWLNIAGEIERNFSPNATQQVVVKVAPPQGAPAGKYQFRLDAVSVTNPDDDFTEGPTVDLEVKPTEAPKKPFPWLIVAAAAGAVVLIVGLTWLLWPSGVEVPDAAGLDVAEATKKFEELGFKVEVARRINPSVAVNHVFGQDPEAKSKAGAGSTVMLLVAAEKQDEAKVVFEENFDDFGKDLSLAWSPVKTVTPPNGKTRFLGEFFNQSVKLTLDKLPEHNTVTVSFDLYIILSWDGNHPVNGADVWGLNLEDGRPLINTTFDNHVEAIQNFACKVGEEGPSRCYSNKGTAGFGASAKNSLGYEASYLQLKDCVYKIKHTFSHNRSFLILNFFDELKEELPQNKNKYNESWGLDNVRIEVR
jgi:PASTA domain-containing protein